MAAPAQVLFFIFSFTSRFWRRCTAKKIDELFAKHSRVYKHSSDTKLLHDTTIIVHTVSRIHKQFTPVRKHSARHFSHFTQLGFHTVRISHSLASLTVRLLIVCVIEQTVWKSMSHSLAFTQFAYLTVWLDRSTNLRCVGLEDQTFPTLSANSLPKCLPIS